MIQNIADIKTNNWSLSISEFGQAVQGIEEINQCIYIILGTIKGSDPFRPDFGSDVFDFIDKPISVAGPGMVNAITDAIAKWEPRIAITSITYESQPQSGRNPAIPAGLIFHIGWAFVGNANIEQLDLLIGPPGGETEDVFIRILGTPDGAGLITSSNNFIPV